MAAPLPISRLLLPIVALVSIGAASPPSALDRVRALFPRETGARVATASVDLNGDGREELLAYVSGPGLCGTGGCSLVVLSPRGRTTAVVARTSVTRLPVRVLPTRHRGWQDLAVAVGGGGLGPAMARLAFDGKRYPANPTLAPTTRTVGRTLIAASTPTHPLHP